MSTIILRHVSLDDIVVEGLKRVVLRGVIDPQSLHLLRIDDYQRDAQPLQTQRSIMEALVSGEPLPEIELGMRGDHWDGAERAVTLYDPVFIIDGLQRVTTALHAMTTKNGLIPHLGAIVHLNTTREWERERFRKLNSFRLKVSPAILLRNMRDESPTIKLLIALSADPAGAIRGRIQWDQRMKKGELMSPLTLARITGYLHAHKGATRSAMRSELIGGIDKLIATIGTKPVRENIITYFDVLDECWGLRTVHYTTGARHLRSSFMFALAKMLSNHTDFWSADGLKLVVSADLRKKIKTFPINKEKVLGDLAGASGKASDHLQQLLVEHVNFGKRSRRLRHRFMPRLVTSGDENETEAAIASGPGPGDDVNGGPEAFGFTRLRRAS